MWLLFLLVSIGVLYLLQKGLYSRFWSRGLSVDLKFEEPYIYEGDSSKLIEIVSNDKRLPLAAVAVRFAMDRNLSFIKTAKENTGVSDQVYKRDIFSILPKQRMKRKLEFVGNKRGFYEIKQVDVVGYNYFFKEHSHISLEQNAGLYVYPKTVDVGRIQVISKALSGEALAKQQLLPDPFEFQGIREYTRADSIRNINWKASAKSGELMVNQFASTTDFHITILLDVEDSRILKYEELVEESIRIASSLVAYWVNRHVTVRIFTNSAEAFAMELKGSYMLQEFFEKMAGLDVTSVSCSLVDLMKEREKNGAKEDNYLMISKNIQEDNISKIKEFTSSNACLWILPYMYYQKEDLYQNPELNMFHWEVGL